MSNENNNNPINEEESLSPTVLAVVNALNGASGSDIGRVTRMMNASQTPSVQYSETLSEEYVEESSEESDVVYVDIYEENGRVTQIDNVVVSHFEPLPGIETIEKFRGAEYANEFINEATQSRTPTKTKKTTTTNKSAVPGQKVAKSNLDPRTGAARAPTGASAPVPAPAGTKKPKPKAPTPASRRTDAATKKEDKPSQLAADIAKRAKETKLDTGNLDLDISDKLKATDKVVDQNVKDATAKLKPGEIKKGSFLNTITGGRFGRGATYTPGDVSAFDDSTKDFTKKVNDTAAQIKAEREKKAAAPAQTPAQTPAPAQPPAQAPAPSDGTTTGGPTDGGSATAPTGDTSGDIKINYKIGDVSSKDIGKAEYLKKKQSGEIKSQKVIFHMKDPVTGKRTRSIGPDSPEYDAYYANYKKIKGAVLEALIRAGAILTEEGWYLNNELIENVELSYSPSEFETQYYYDEYNNLRIMSEEDFAELSLAEAVVEMQVQMQLTEELDEVGSEDEDVDNDGDSDKSDDYLKNRREAVSKAMQKKTMKEESSEEETEVEQVEEEVEQIAPAQRTNWPWRK